MYMSMWQIETLPNMYMSMRQAEALPDTLLPGLWMAEESVGDAGASSLGYYGGAWAPDGNSIVAHGFTGALHLWRRDGEFSCILLSSTYSICELPYKIFFMQVDSSFIASNVQCAYAACTVQYVTPPCLNCHDGIYCCGAEGGSGGWVPHPALGGHYGAVVDLAWGIDGRCLVSVSEDQTARIWSTVGDDGRWCELARPQVCAHLPWAGIILG